MIGKRVELAAANHAPIAVVVRRSLAKADRSQERLDVGIRQVLARIQRHGTQPLPVAKATATAPMMINHRLMTDLPMPA